MIFYLTYNDLPSGIFSSQVIDVVKFLNNELKAEVKLVSFISLRGFFENRRKIRSDLPQALVLPMYPRLQNWKNNKVLLNFVCKKYKPSKIIGRSVLATQLALQAREARLCKEVIYDGRGAIAAEWKEYKVVFDQKLLSEIPELEKQVVIGSNAQIAVSNKLVDHWKAIYGYTSDKFKVIPCTLNKIFEEVEITEQRIKKSRVELGLEMDDVVLIYSGSDSGWQSFNVLISFVKAFLKASIKNKIIFLSSMSSDLFKLKNEFPKQVIIKKVAPSKVPDHLIAADHGLLIREKSITNQVASPVKFAEYLSCGLSIIISESLGDYSELVLRKNLGSLYNTKNIDHKRIALDNKISLSLKAKEMFSKKHFIKEYKELIS